MTYRTPDPASAADALRAEVARLRAKPARVPMRWIIDTESVAAFAVTAAVIAIGLTGGLCLVGRFIEAGVIYSGAPQERRAFGVCGTLLLVWALAFVRRVPAEGARS